MKLIPVILCGGAGSRLWPISREMYPKPFIRLQDNQSLLQKAFLRSIDQKNVAEVVTVSNKEFYFITAEHLDEVNSDKINCSYILEPIGRNTAPAIASAAIYVAQKYGNNANILVLAADHIISKNENFKLAVEQACILAEQNHLVTFGINPTAPDTGYGYIEADGNTVKRFVEKPNLEKAQEYISQGNFYWNSGMFCFSVGELIRQMQKFCPDIYDGVCKSFNLANVSKTNKNSQKIELEEESFSKIRDDSIDYALMEKAESVAVIPCDLGWSDVGSWNAISELIAADENGNRVIGQAEINESKNCTIFGSDRIIGIVGAKDLVVVDTPDALLITEKSRVQNVKNIYTELKKKGHETYRWHRTVNRPWGTYTVIENGNSFKIKRIEVKPSASLSLQMHHHRSEHWIVVEGIAKVVNGEKSFIVKVNESTYIPVGNKHRLENPGASPLVMIEVQVGSYLGEDDIVRFDDIYGRV